MNEWEWRLLEDKQPVEHVKIGGARLKVGSRVRLRPRSGGDIMDIALADQTATIEAIEQDYEGNLHVCVVLDEDPGRDLGILRQPGHRFFFASSEVEPLLDSDVTPRVVKPAILVAGIGNIFQGDDAFGVEVAHQLLRGKMPKKVRVTDFGIRGLDLAYALQDGYETVILVDAVQRGGAPGTLYVIKPELDMELSEQIQNVAIDSHGMDPVRVMRLATHMGAILKTVLLVGCEPENLGGEDGHMGLSASVEVAVREAVKKIEQLVEQLLEGQ